MEFVVLGFLLIRSLSQYDILKALSKDVSPFYQPSLGSIQNALNKLLVKGFITKKSIHDTGRKKNLYTISEKGTLYFEKWMLSDFSETKFETELNTRLFFLGHLTPPQRLYVLKTGKAFVEKTLSTFKNEVTTIDNQFANIRVSDTVYYQIKTLDLAIHNSQSILYWLTKEIDRMEIKNHE